jgi:IstB-like ATP binding protein/Mu transposase, C-terminal domain/Homeodomain-like domain
MMTQEEFMDVVALRRQGWTITDIAAELGRHPETVSKWLKRGGPPARRQVDATVIDRRWIDQLLERNPTCLEPRWRLDNMGALVARAHPRLVLDPPSSIGELTTRAARWLATVVHPRAHRVTSEPPAARRVRERPLLGPLPRVGYDTARREPRVVPRVPLVEFGGSFYSVPPEHIRQVVEVRLPIGATTLEVWAAGGRIIARHQRVPAGNPPVWDPTHRQAAEQPALRRHRRPPRHLELVDPSSPPCLADLDLGPGRYEVLPMLLDRARTEGLSHAQFLAELVAEEAAATRNRRLSARLRFAHFPVRRTPDEFDFDFQPSVDRKLVADLATLRFVTQGTPVLLLGQPGCGKTHLAIALATLAVEAGYRGYFTLRRRPGRHHHQRLRQRHLHDQDPHLHRAKRAGDRRRRAHPTGPGRRQRPLPGCQPPLRAQLLNHRHHQPRPARLGRAVRRRRRGRRHPGPPAAPGRGHQHQGPKLAHARAPSPRRSSPRGGGR